MAKGSGMRPSMQRRENYNPAGKLRSASPSVRPPMRPKGMAAGGVAKERLEQNTVGKVKRN